VNDQLVRDAAVKVAALANEQLTEVRTEHLSIYATLGARFQLAVTDLGLDLVEDSDVVLVVLAAIMSVVDQTKMPTEGVLAGALHVTANFR
jgi:hypothetical protein